MFKVSDYSALSKIDCYFCSIYTFSSVEIDTEIEEVGRSENVDGIKYTSCLNSYTSMTFYIFKISDYFVSSKINCRFSSVYTFSSVEIDTEIDEVGISENVDGTKHASCLNSYASMTFYIRLLCFIRNQLSLLFHIRFLFCWDRYWDWRSRQIGKRWWNLV
jgi:hypothetical protein